MELPALLYIAIAVAVVLVGVFAGRRKTSAPRTNNYRTLCIVGLSWIPIGLGTENTTFWILGSVFVLVGLANRDKWDS